MGNKSLSLLTHVHSRLDGVIEENAVHGLTDALAAAEREREVAHAARHTAALRGENYSFLHDINQQLGIWNKGAFEVYILMHPIPLKID